MRGIIGSVYILDLQKGIDDSLDLALYSYSSISLYRGAEP